MSELGSILKDQFKLAGKGTAAIRAIATGIEGAGIGLFLAAWTPLYGLKECKNLALRDYPSSDTEEEEAKCMGQIALSLVPAIATTVAEVGSYLLTSKPLSSHLGIPTLALYFAIPATYCSVMGACDSASTDMAELAKTEPARPPVVMPHP